MGQELELPRPILIEITKDSTRRETIAAVSFSEKIHTGQH